MKHALEKLIGDCVYGSIFCVELALTGCLRYCMIDNSLYILCVTYYRRGNYLLYTRSSLYLFRVCFLTNSQLKINRTMGDDVSLEESVLTFVRDVMRLSPHLTDITVQGLVAAFRSLNLAVESNDLLGSRNVANNSKSAYHKHIRGLFKFLSMIGDYVSLLVLYNGMSRELVQSMNSKHVALYMLYKTQSKQTNLRHIGSDGANVMDVFAAPIMCCGDWNCIVNVDQFLSAVSAVHEAIGQGDRFKDVCQRCVAALEADARCTGCNVHLGQYNFRRRGNPRSSTDVKNTYKKCDQLMVGHQVKSCYQLVPSEVHALRRNLTSTNQLKDLQLYCMILMAIYLFLRHDDIYDLEFASYIPHLSTVRSDGSVDNLVFKVHGKSDIEYKYLVLWACHDKPELCPVRHLLVYIHLCNITEGYLFPNLDDSDNRKTYDSFLNYLKRKISPVLTRDMPITTHSFRKTGYLFACWGGGEFAVIMDSARHKTHAVAMNYYRDAKTTLHLMMLSGDSNEDNIIPDWKAVIVHQPENVRILIDGIVILPLQDVARGYARYVKIEEEPLKSRSIHQILELTYRKNSTAMSKEAIKASLHSELSNLAPEKQHKITAIFNNLLSLVSDNDLQPNLRSVHYEEQQNGDSNQSHAGLQMSRRQQDCSGERKSMERTQGERKRTRKRVRLEEDLIARKDLPDDPNEKLSVLHELYAKAASNKSSLTGGAKVFYYNALKPIETCLMQHFQGDSKRFLEKWDNLTGDLYRFNAKCCNGKTICGETK